MIGSAFLVAWGAEAAEFLMSQGLALALLALLQTLPEFAVEAVIAWKAGKDPNMVHLAIANFTGSLRLLTGLGWPMIYGVAAFFAPKRRGGRSARSRLSDDHAVEVVGLLPPLAYFVVVWAKGSLSLVDAAVLATIYVVYLVDPAQDPAARGDRGGARGDPARLPLGALVSGGRRWAAVLLLLAGGGARDLLRRASRSWTPCSPWRRARHVAVRVHPVGRAVPLRVPREDVRVRLGAPGHAAPVALMNMVSSNINQWGILSGLLAVIYCWSHGSTEPLPFDAFQRHEILLTILQAFLGWLFLASMDLEAYEAAGLFLLWLVQFLMPSSRHAMLCVYGAWIALEVLFVAVGRKKLAAFGAFAGLEGAPMSGRGLSRRAAALAPSSTIAVGKAAKALAARASTSWTSASGSPTSRRPTSWPRPGRPRSRAGRTKYTDVAGEPDLRDAIAEKYRARTGRGRHAARTCS